MASKKVDIFVPSKRSPLEPKFLGFSFLKDKKATIRLAPQTISRFKEKVREWIGYFRLASAKGHCESSTAGSVEGCACVSGSNRNGYRTRIRELRALGVPEWACLVMANSRRGAWEMSRNTINALPTSYWEAKGMKSLLTRYLELC